MGDIFSKVCSDMSDNDADEDEDEPMEDVRPTRIKSDVISGESDSEDEPMEDVKSKTIKAEVSSGDSASEDTDDSDDESVVDVKPSKLIKLELNSGSGECDNAAADAIDRPLKKRKSRISMHIRRISRKLPYPVSGRVECSQCGRMVLFYAGGYKQINYRGLVDHAAYHLKRPIYKCQICHLLMPKSSTKAHIKAQHAAEYEKLTSSNAPIVCRSIDGIEDEINEMLTKCFDKPQDGWRSEESNDKAIYRIKLHAQVLWKTYASGQSIHCNQCSRLISLNGSRYEVIEQHASMHLCRNLFKCNICGTPQATKQAVIRHLRTVHVLSSNDKNYADLRAGSKEAVIAAMNRCFAPSTDPALEVETMEEGELKSKHRECTQILKARFKRNELELERRLHCTDLVQKHTKSGKVKCRVCEHQIGVKQQGGTSNQKPLLHSFTHLEDGIHLFKCKRCKQPIKDMFSVYRHMKSKHQIVNGIKKEIDDFTNDHHREIMENLTKCYDWN